MNAGALFWAHSSINENMSLGLSVNHLSGFPKSRPKEPKNSTRNCSFVIWFSIVLPYARLKVFTIRLFCLLLLVFGLALCLGKCFLPKMKQPLNQNLPHSSQSVFSPIFLPWSAAHIELQFLWKWSLVFH